MTNMNKCSEADEILKSVNEVSVLNLLHSDTWTPCAPWWCSRRDQGCRNVLRVVVLLVVLPHGFGSDPKPFANRRLVIINAILDPVGFAGVVKNQTLIILSTGIHHLTKHVERRKHTEERLVQALAILNHILTEDKHVIDVCTQVWTQVHTILHSQQKEYFPVTPVHETLSDTRVFHERLVVHAIVQKQKSA